MAQNLVLNIFEKAHGKANVRRYNIGDNSWTALLCQDEDGNEIFISPPNQINVPLLSRLSLHLSRTLSTKPNPRYKLTSEVSP